MGSSVPRFPVTHKSLSLDIKGNKTDVVLCSYDDHFLVVATQIGAMGTILHARKEEGVSIEPTFNVSSIFGKRDEHLWLPQIVGAFSWTQGPFCGDTQGNCFCCD
ncbi:hypothetical protein I3843_03G035600 [Carya illinoinensis]|uniref:Proteasome assembly chaperone 3 n=1 Tax=Carya illinoinensis TaxID=32201 RepID=A0A922FGZ0_CARIL|nr:hypothetical protein I3760_03G032300 [Carya illinoinensis]KAG6719958.1 hypothetical protein I3842_03G033700 [Carya illinoinensis]KAG7985619.1 hypothetical protein I3843_03G035600 [Carya illinoinensis]